MKSPLSLIHTSDVHLDDSQMGDRAVVAFEKVVSLVCERGPDLFLIAGDLFEHNRIQEPLIEFVYEQLCRVHCPTVMIPGNHDCFNEQSVFKRMQMDRGGHNVHLLSAEQGESVQLDDCRATIWGRGMVEHEPDYRPLAGVPNRTEDHWHIGMAHGFYVELDDPMRSSLITANEVASSGLDYLAMGHVHVFNEYQCGPTLACYPGTPMPGYGAGARGGSVAIVDLLPEHGVRLAEHKLDLPRVDGE